MSLHFIISLWIVFLSGVFVHGWIRADSAVKSRLNGIGSYEQYVRQNAASFAFRLFLSMMIFIAWMTDNNFIKDAIGYIPIAKGWFANIPMEIPLNIPTAGLFGAGSDLVLDYIAKKAGLSAEIPPVGGITISAKETKTQTTASGTTETVKEQEMVVSPDTKQEKP